MAQQHTHGWMDGRTRSMVETSTATSLDFPHLHRGSELSQRKEVSCFLAMCRLLGDSGWGDGDGRAGAGGSSVTRIFFGIFSFSMGSAKAWAGADSP